MNKLFVDKSLRLFIQFSVVGNNVGGIGKLLKASVNLERRISVSLSIIVVIPSIASFDSSIFSKSDGCP